MSERFKLAFKTSLGLASEEVKMSRARKEKRWSRLLAKSRIYHSPPLVLYQLKGNKTTKKKENSIPIAELIIHRTHHLSSHWLKAYS